MFCARWPKQTTVRAPATSPRRCPAKQMKLFCEGTEDSTRESDPNVPRNRSGDGRGNADRAAHGTGATLSDGVGNQQDADRNEEKPHQGFSPRAPFEIAITQMAKASPRLEAARSHQDILAGRPNAASAGPTSPDTAQMRKIAALGVKKCPGADNGWKAGAVHRGAGLSRMKARWPRVPASPKNLSRLQRRCQFLRIDARRGAACRKAVPQHVITIATRCSCRFSLTGPRPRNNNDRPPP